MTSAIWSPQADHRRRLTIGTVEVTALSDGFLDASLEILQNITTDAAERMLTDAARPCPPRISVNAFLVRSGGRTALIDTGSGSSMGPTLGGLPGSLAAAGVDPASIDSILLTHMHPDHSNGLAGADGKALFPNAEVILHEHELAHWRDDAQMSRATERQRSRYFEAARKQLDPYAEHLRPVRSGEVFPCVSALAIPGHTPGHTGYIIASGDDALIVWGDIVHVPEIQVPRPEVSLSFDSDPMTAAATRLRVFDMIVADRLLIGGMHLNYSGFARMTREAGRYWLSPLVD
ncbi:MAG: MBL fold metallo-hydrolase [Hyphomonadaceae bacterium]|nr:MBL fold metallo-hydrolase [Hyphomonadaceae bacterium]